jgi:DNA-binding NarL/FixJ family response regulator
MDLALAVRSVAAGKAWLDPTVARTLISEFASRPDPDLPSPGELAALTDREREVLVLIAHGLGTGAIADHLMITAATAKTHIGRILMKLGLRDRSQAVVAAYKSGLVHPGDAPPSSLHPRR